VSCRFDFSGQAVFPPVFVRHPHNCIDGSKGPNHPAGPNATTGTRAN
jgi:hypothetical protein